MAESQLQLYNCIKDFYSSQQKKHSDLGGQHASIANQVDYLIQEFFNVTEVVIKQLIEKKCTDDNFNLQEADLNYLKPSLRGEVIS